MNQLFKNILSMHQELYIYVKFNFLFLLVIQHMFTHIPQAKKLDPIQNYLALLLEQSYLMFIQQIILALSFHHSYMQKYIMHKLIYPHIQQPICLVLHDLIFIRTI